jgi:hypothetical protein
MRSRRGAGVGIGIGIGIGGSGGGRNEEPTPTAKNEEEKKNLGCTIGQRFGGGRGQKGGGSLESSFRLARYLSLSSFLTLIFPPSNPHREGLCASANLGWWTNCSFFERKGGFPSKRPLLQKSLRSKSHVSLKRFFPSPTPIPLAIFTARPVLDFSLSASFR